jgi:hypothetical protein
VVVIVFLTGLAAGMGYVRLRQGPIALDMLAPMVARALAAELAGRQVRIDGLDLELDEQQRLRLVVRQMQITEADGAPLALTPKARLQLSTVALRRGVLAPERIELVGPRLQVAFGEDGALSVRVAPATGVPPVAASGSAAPAAPRAPLGDQAVPLVRALAELSERARKRESATRYLKAVGVTQAVVILGDAQRRTIWNIPEADLDLDHNRKRSHMVAQATVASLTGPWTISLQMAEAADAGQLDVEIAVRGINPRGLARTVPALAAFERFDVPLDIDARIALGTDGRVRSSRLLARGDAAAAQFAGRAGPGAIVDRVRAEATYDGASGRIDLPMLQLGYAASEVTLKGTVGAPPVPGQPWSYTLDAVGGQVGPAMAGSAPTRIDHLAVQGTADTVAGRFVLSGLTFRAGGAEVTAGGSIARGPRGPQGAIDGRLGAMSARQFMAIWPEALAPRARAWVGSHLTKGAVASGSFRAALEPPAEAGGAADVRLSMTLEAGGVELKLAEGVPPLEIPRGLVRVEGQSLEITAPEATVAAADNRRLALRAARFTAVETAPGEQPTAELAFRLVGPLAAALDIADRPGLQVLKSRGLSLPGLDGRIDGQVKLLFPLAENVQATELRADAKVRLTDLRARQFAGGIDLSGGMLAVDVDDKAIDLKGDLLLKGIAAKLNWQYLFNVPPAQQAPVRIVTTLDNADRLALGLDVADLVQGETPVEVTIGFDAQGQSQTRVRADLSKAELTFEAIAWRKPPGRAAVLQFDPARGPGSGAAQRIELQNVRLVGDDVAMEGWMAIGPDNRLREFSFPVFSVNTVSRLEAHGKLRADRVWEVRAKGPTFDGRDLFRGFFNLGQIADRPKPLERNGIDLVAEIDTVLGFTDTNLKAVRVRVSRREDKITALDVRANLDSGKPFAATIHRTPNAGRQLRAHGNDAGQIFKLVGFYPNAVGGELKLEVNLDSLGPNEKSGMLWAEKFAVLGDPVVSEVFQNVDANPTSGAGPRQRVTRTQFDFDTLAVPFNIGSGQFVMNGAVLRGPLIGATLRGRIDFRGQTVNIGGTYVPLSGLNSALGGLLGPLSGGPQGEGLFGITFAVQGPLARPQAIVNPLSLLGPGIFREIFQMTPETFRIQPRDDKPPPGSPAARVRAKAGDAAVRASSAAPGDAPASPAGSAGPTAGAPAAAPRVKPEIGTGSEWNAETVRSQRP